jgi:beta-phosphoglucomutase family hydrolase
MPNKIQGVIWDLDGVIIDSGEEHRKAWQKLAREEGIAFSDEQFWATFGWRNDAIIPVIWGPVSPEQIRELADRKEAYFREFVREVAAPLPGAIELLRGLRDAGYKQALGSSTPIANIDLISEALGLKRFISVFVSGETVPRGKPAPDIFLKAAELLGLAPEHCLVIEDAVAGIQAAQAGGMYTIAVAGDRDLQGLRAATLMVKDLTEVNVERIRELA